MTDEVEIKFSGQVSMLETLELHSGGAGNHEGELVSL